MATPDKKQIEMKEQIRVYLRKKDYYDILGLPKTCDQAEIKKAYKKLALRFHPDKNSVDGSKEVFKKVSNAYTNLIDPEKRASYDRYGPEEDREPRYRPQRQYRQGYTQQDEFQQIFRAFFGGGMPRGNFHNNHYQQFTFNMGGPRGQNNQGNGGTGFFYFMIFIIVIYVLPAFFSKQQALYSSSPSSTYRIPMKTTIFQVPYYVRQEYLTQNKNGQHTKTVEAAIDFEYIAKLKKQCDMLQWSRGYGSSQAVYQQKYRASCRRFQQLQEKHPEYFRDLIYNY